MKTLSRVALALSLCTALVAGPALAETVKQEKAEHPRIAKAIHELEDAIKYMEEAPHDFGGKKAQALESSRKALADLLVGEPGRYVALIMPGDGDAPTLEWALGEKRGSMSSPLVSSGAQTQLELKIDPATGELAALVGNGRDQRLLGDSVTLGPGWRSLFGEPPRAAVGCLEGLCGFNLLEERTLELPPSPTPKVELPVSTEEPNEPHHTTIAQAHNAPPPHNSPPPRPPVHNAPPPTGKKQPLQPPQGKKK